MNATQIIDERSMEKAFYARDSGYDGLFFTGVRTTGIFCRPTCTARKPRRENIEFFRSAREALNGGYRPCLVCRPMEARGATPDWVRTILDAVYADHGTRMKDADIRARGTDPARLRRWFRANHGMTFQAYLRALRIGRAFGRIKRGGRILDTAYDSGYESLSGFNDAFKKAYDGAPGKPGFEAVITTTRITTPLGPMLAGSGAGGICLLEFVDRRMLETQVARLSRRFRARFMPGVTAHLAQLQKEMDEYFAGARTNFDVPLETAGTPFQELVWNALRGIPYAQTVSYGELARRIGRPRAMRAVARANGDNRIAIIIPCHRVIGMDGTLTGYGGGLWRKRHLIDLERDHGGMGADTLPVVFKAR
ncbi:MAG: bifunctional transcriptional activator/DNA repair protein Ada [Spirochaetes bacterium]|nr:MAG: bifunctional transcriptional activator/DNA repair protein Ada [Spirochaetota bacterium]